MIKEEYQALPTEVQQNKAGLTPRQLEVLALLVEGGANKEIARCLNLAEATVKMHVTAILRCLDVNNRTKAARAVEQAGITLPEINV